MDAEMLQGIGAIGALMVAHLALFGSLLWWQLSILERRINTVHTDLERRMDRNHREVLTLLEGHDHPDDGPPAFRRLPGSGNQRG